VWLTLDTSGVLRPQVDLVKSRYMNQRFDMVRISQHAASHLCSKHLLQQARHRAAEASPQRLAALPPLQRQQLSGHTAACSWTCFSATGAQACFAAHLVSLNSLLCGAGHGPWTYVQWCWRLPAQDNCS
jgi:hypothetical protein